MSILYQELCKQEPITHPATSPPPPHTTSPDQNHTFNQPPKSGFAFHSHSYCQKPSGDPLTNHADFTFP